METHTNKTIWCNVLELVKKSFVRAFEVYEKHILAQEELRLKMWILLFLKQVISYSLMGLLCPYQLLYVVWAKNDILNEKL